MAVGKVLWAFFGFRQVKGDLNVVWDVASSLVASKDTHSCFVLMWSFARSFVNLRAVTQQKLVCISLSIPGSLVEVDVKSESNRYYPQGVDSATGEAGG